MNDFVVTPTDNDLAQWKQLQIPQSTAFGLSLGLFAFDLSELYQECFVSGDCNLEGFSEWAVGAHFKTTQIQQTDVYGFCLDQDLNCFALRTYYYVEDSSRPI